MATSSLSTPVSDISPSINPKITFSQVSVSSSPKDGDISIFKMHMHPKPLYLLQIIGLDMKTCRVLLNDDTMKKFEDVLHSSQLQTSDVPSCEESFNIFKEFTETSVFRGSIQTLVSTPCKKKKNSIPWFTICVGMSGLLTGGLVGGVLGRSVLGKIRS